MTRNQASGGDRVRVARSHDRRQSAAETRASPLTARSLRTAVAVIEFGAYRFWLPGDLGPGGDPLLERHAIVLAVAALRQRRLPELDGLEVGLRRVRVVGGAGALRDLVHDRAGQLVGRGLTEEDRLLRLHLGGRRPLHPLVGAVGV